MRNCRHKFDMCIYARELTCPEVVEVNLLSTPYTVFPRLGDSIFPVAEATHSSCSTRTAETLLETKNYS
jgi:hypothetical protein